MISGKSPRPMTRNTLGISVWKSRNSTGWPSPEGWHHTSSGNTFPSSGELFGGSPICWNHPCPHHRCFCRRFGIVVLLTLFSPPSQQQKNICYLLPRWFSAGLAKRIEQGKGEVSTRSGTQSTQLQGGEENKPGQC